MRGYGRLIAESLLIAGFVVVLGVAVAILGPVLVPNHLWAEIERVVAVVVAFVGLNAGLLTIIWRVWTIGKSRRQESPRREAEFAGVYAATCGDNAIDLGDQRLLLSTAFGSYLSGLLEREQTYVALDGQVDCPASGGQEGWEPIQRVLWALVDARGPRLIIIAAEGGMGKTTVAAKVVRCLVHQHQIDRILGDSAKTQRVDPATDQTVHFEPGYYGARSFYERLYQQIGLPPLVDKWSTQAVTDRLHNRRAVILVDNLETVERGDELLRSLQAITSREVRGIVTTRQFLGSWRMGDDTLVVRIKPILEFDVARSFLRWHIERHRHLHPALDDLEQDLDDRKLIELLVKRTGGIPLLMQLLCSDIAAGVSWDYLEQLPRVFGDELLAFLYMLRWDDLGGLGREGSMARELLQWVAAEQYRGRKVTLQSLVDWATHYGTSDFVPSALRLLYERFLIVNHDSRRGDFTVFPSLVEFLDRQTDCQRVTT